MTYYTSSWMGNLTSHEIEYYVNEYASDTEVIVINDEVKIPSSESLSSKHLHREDHGPKPT